MVILHNHRPPQRQGIKPQTMGIVQHAYRNSIQIIVNYETVLRESVQRDFDFHPQILRTTLVEFLDREVLVSYSDVERRLCVGVDNIDPAEYNDVLRRIYLFFASRVEPRYIVVPPKITQAPQPF